MFYASQNESWRLFDGADDMISRVIKHFESISMRLRVKRWILVSRRGIYKSYYDDATPCYSWPKSCGGVGGANATPSQLEAESGRRWRRHSRTCKFACRSFSLSKCPLDKYIVLERCLNKTKKKKIKLFVIQSFERPKSKKLTTKKKKKPGAVSEQLSLASQLNQFRPRLMLQLISNGTLS